MGTDNMRVDQLWAIEDLNRTRQIRLNQMFGITHELKFERNKNGITRATQGAHYPEDTQYRRFASLSEAYIEFSGDPSIQHLGRNVRAQQVAALASFEMALANVCNRLLIQDFATEYRWRDIVTSITGPQDFRPNVRTRIKYVPDLPDLTEDQPYTDNEPPPSDDESFSYTVNQKGKFFSFSRRVVVNDDIGLIKRAVEQLGRAAWRTLAKRVWNLLIANADYGVDGVPMFDATHGNLGSAALSTEGLTTARQAIFAQCEPNSTERLGLGGGPLLLAVPIQLEETALTLNVAQFIDPDLNPNPWLHRFGPESERIFANPLFTDANDWYLFDISGKAGIIEVGFLMGRQDPEVIQSSPYTDSEFFQDRVTYKLRHEYECAIVDYRGAYKSVVA